MSACIIIIPTDQNYVAHLSLMWWKNALETWFVNDENFHLLTASGQVCSFPPNWRDTWLINGFQSILEYQVTSNTITSKGTCQASGGDNRYLLLSQRWTLGRDRKNQFISYSLNRLAKTYHTMNRWFNSFSHLWHLLTSLSSMLNAH